MSNIYTGSMGMIAFENKINAIGNNIANAKTNGYKKDIDTMKVFEESYMRIISNEENRRIGPYYNQVHTDQFHTNFTQGVLKNTNRMLDVAIYDRHIGDGPVRYHFFEVERNGEVYLTRDGQFQLDVDGNLSLGNGAYVLNTQGERINLQGYKNLAITRDGQIVDSSSGEVIDTLQIRGISEENSVFLEKSGANLFRVMTLQDIENNFGPLENILDMYPNNMVLQRLLNEETLLNAQMTGELNIFEDGFTGELHQGMLEQSNVNLADELTELMLAQKGFSASSKFLTTMDQINEKDANDIAK